MKTIDFSSIIVFYNFVIGVLLVLSSQKLSEFAGQVNGRHGAAIARLTYVSMSAFGSVVAAFSAIIYLAFHVLKIGV